MHLEKLQLMNFKNYEELALEFPSRINFLLGLNGSGKTNLLEAIYYLSTTKSFSNSSDTQNIRYGADYFFIRGFFTNTNKRSEVFCQIQSGRKKVFQENSRDYEKISDHIGKYPVVLISPLDVDLVKESSEARRKFFDQMIAQIDHSYLNALLEYHHALKQRNALLKLFAENNSIDYDIIDLYDQQMARSGGVIYQKRKAFVAEFLPIFNASYNLLVDNREEATLAYASELESAEFEAGLKSSIKKDLILQRTTFGVHRDDYVFGFAHGELKRLGSQGQQKSFLVAIKLAQVEVIKSHLGFSPILLLDDIFDKLDDTRIARLLRIISGADYGQSFITDAGPERTQAMVNELEIDCDIFSVEKGSIQFSSIK
ncbi:MAG TPA: DNA replication/repair protein RecF [Cyclobacteriaceae bacterium]|nr:DNA replication/repair protein RecF [Cyclobacteriaceae bacterium]HRJ81344.1 DNA replication/repair protein RecF [Cyclobacteriaceae bacterium]